jgi:ribonuclease BN (tRNA processing enzyme)
VAICHDDAARPVLILDAGTGLRRVTPLLEGRPFEGTLLLTHLHWDHVHGLPFFQAGDRDDARVTLLLPDQESGESAARVLARGMSPPHFPIGPDGLRGDWRFGVLPPGQLKAEGFTVEAREVPHKGGRTYGYRVSDGHSVLTYIPDHCPIDLGPGPDGLGEYHAAALDLAAGTDLLIHDAFWLAGETAPEASFGHAAAQYAARLGMRAGARRVALAHHKPDRTDDELDEVAGRFAAGGPGAPGSPGAPGVPGRPEIFVAAEGGILEL